MRLDETLLQTLQAAQAVGAQHAQQVGVGGVSGGAAHAGAFAHLKVTRADGRTQPHVWTRAGRLRWRALPEQAASGTAGKNGNGSPQRSADPSFPWERMRKGDTYTYAFHKKSRLNVDLPDLAAEGDVKAPAGLLVEVLPFSQHLVKYVPAESVKDGVSFNTFRGEQFSPAPVYPILGVSADTGRNSGLKPDSRRRYLCFLNVWKALSLLKLERLSVAGSKGTEWMKVETDGESCNRTKGKLVAHEINEKHLKILQAKGDFSYCLRCLHGRR